MDPTQTLTISQVIQWRCGVCGEFRIGCRDEETAKDEATIHFQAHQPAEPSSNGNGSGMVSRLKGLLP